MKISAWKVALIAILILAGAVAPLSAPAKAQSNKIVIALDFGHGESDKYVNYIVSNVTFAEFKFINGTINSSALEGVDVLILGQPTVSFDVDEMNAINAWLQEGNKVLWVAGDSDYGSGNETQKIVNELLEYIGAKLRVEYASVYDDVHNCQRFYRVLFRVMPDNVPGLHTDIISENITKPILGHGPAPIIWQDDNGTYHDIVKDTFPGLVRIAWSYDTAYIGDNSLPSPLVYDVFSYGQGSGNHTFVFIAAEYWKDLNDIIVVSGESPYGDYEPIWSWEYYGVQLDGPQFVTNMFKWFQTVIQTQQPPTNITTTTLPGTVSTTTSPANTTQPSTNATTTMPSVTSPTTTPSPSPTTSAAGTGTSTQPASSTQHSTTSPTTTTGSAGGAGGGATQGAGGATTTPAKAGGQTALVAVVIIIIVIIVGAYFFIKK